MALAELKTADVAAWARAITRGYAIDGDGGGGSWLWDPASTATADDVFVVQKTGTETGRWLRQYDGLVNVKWFGTKGDGSTDDTAAIQAAIDSGKPIYFPVGTYAVASSLKFKAGGTILIGEKMPGMAGGQTRILDLRTSGDEPILRNPAGWKQIGGTFTDGQGGTPSAWTSLNQIRIEGIAFEAPGANLSGTCVQVFGATTTHLENCRFSGARGLEIGESCFDNTVLNCQADGGAVITESFWTDPPDTAGLRARFGFSSTGHTYLFGVACNACGTGIWASGQGVNVFGARIENCGYGMAIGYNRDALGGNEVYPLFRSTITGVSLEASWIGISVNNLATGAAIENVVMQGSLGEEARPYDAYIGLEVLGVSDHAEIRNVNTIGTYTRAGIVNFTRRPLIGCDATNNNATAAKLGAAFRPLGRSDNGADPEVYHFLRTQLFPWAAKPRHKTITAFHDLMLPGLTGVNIRDLGASGDSQGGPVFARNLGGVETVANGATTKAVAFEAALSAEQVYFNTAPTAQANAGSTLAAGTYYYATTVVGRHGEVGINYASAAANNYRSVTIGSQEEATMGYVDYSSRGTRRIYRGTVLGEFDGYWEVTGTSFVDDGTVAFDGYGMPPKMGGLTARTEDDANYQIVATPSWATTVHVTGKATTGFTLNFGTAAPDANQTVAWLLFRP